MKTAFLLVVPFLQPHAASAVVLWQRRSVRDLRMQPEVVAQTLAQVERSWMAQASTFVECNANDSRLSSHCAKPEKSFLQSCSSVMGAVVKASSGQRAVVKEYMQDVCSEPVLQGAWKENCLGFAAVLVQSMTGDSYTNREKVGLAEPCAKLWQLFTKGEAKREESQENVVEEEQKHAAEEAKAKAKFAVDAKKKTKKNHNARVAAETKKKTMNKNKARVVAQAKRKAANIDKARAMAGAKKVKEEAQADVPQKAKEGAEKQVVDQARKNGQPGSKANAAEDAQKKARKLTTSSSKAAASRRLSGNKAKGTPASPAGKAIAKVEHAPDGSVKRALPVRAAAPRKTIAKEAVVTKVAKKAVVAKVAKK